MIKQTPNYSIITQTEEKAMEEIRRKRNEQSGSKIEWGIDIDRERDEKREGHITEDVEISVNFQFSNDFSQVRLNPITNALQIAEPINRGLTEPMQSLMLQSPLCSL